MKTLGRWWIAYGILRVVVGLALIVCAPTATVMFGALLGRVANPFALMGLFHLLYVLAILMSFACGIVGVIAGLASQRGDGSGRTALLAASFLAFTGFPLGIALATYTLIVCVPWRQTEQALR